MRKYLALLLLNFFCVTLSVHAMLEPDNEVAAEIPTAPVQPRNIQSSFLPEEMSYGQIISFELKDLLEQRGFSERGLASVGVIMQGFPQVQEQLQRLESFPPHLPYAKPVTCADFDAATFQGPALLRGLLQDHPTHAFQVTMYYQFWIENPKHCFVAFHRPQQAGDASVTMQSLADAYDEAKISAFKTIANWLVKRDFKEDDPLYTSTLASLENHPLKPYIGSLLHAQKIRIHNYSLHRQCTLATQLVFEDTQDPVEQYNLGILYRKGWIGLKENGIPDFDKAADWHTKAANQGDANAQFSLGMFYAEGRIGLTADGTPDYDKAVELYTKAANQDHTKALFNLGALYANGRIGLTADGTPDYNKVAEWYEKAANQGEVKAQCNLGNLYSNAKIGLKEDGATDYDKAVEWLAKAANQGDASAQCNLGGLYEEGRVGLKTDDTPDYDKAVEWYTQSANQGESMAQFNLENLYLQGYISLKSDGAPDYDKAAELYTKPAKRGDTKAQYLLGKLYEKGRIGLKADGTPDYDKAAEWYTNPAKKDDTKAQYLLGKLYEKGRIGLKADGTPDYDKAAEWYTNPAKRDDTKAQYLLGELYEKGRIGLKADGAPDYNKAAEWYTKAANQGHVPSRNQLERLYMNARIGTIGGQENDEKKMKSLKTARTKKNPEQMDLGQYTTYAQAIDYRNAGWDAQAQELFFQLSVFTDNAKAMHNVAQIFYKKSDFESALQWFKSAEAFGLEASGRNIKRMQKAGETGPFQKNGVHRLGLRVADTTIDVMRGGGYEIRGTPLPPQIQITPDISDRIFIKEVTEKIGSPTVFLYSV